MKPAWAELVALVRGIYATDGFVPLHEPRFRGNEKAYLARCIDTTFVSSVGEYVDRFEEACAAYTGARHAVAAVNGTAALHVALVLAGVEPGDLVVTQPLTFVATANAIVHAGATPLFVDVDDATWGLCPDALAAYLDEHAVQDGGVCRHRASGAAIRACVPVHTFGLPCRADALADLCARRGIALVEDAAESLGSRREGRHTGTFGRAGILSFNGNKTVTCGGGGMILTDDAELAARAKHLTTTAKVPHRWEFRHDAVAWNYRLTNLGAALGCAQMEQLDALLAAKREVAGRYRDFCAEHGLDFRWEPDGTRANFWLNAVVLPSRGERDAFLAYTNDQGVMTRPAWQLMSDSPVHGGSPAGPLDRARRIAERVVNIPSSAP